MATPLFGRMVEIARSLKEKAAIVRWTEIVAAVEAGEGLSEAEQIEAKTTGEAKLAKRAVKTALPDRERDLFDWASGSFPDHDGGRVAFGASDGEIYDRLIAQLERAIAGLTLRLNEVKIQRDLWIIGKGDGGRQTISLGDID